MISPDSPPVGHPEGRPAGIVVSLGMPIDDGDNFDLAAATRLGRRVLRVAVPAPLGRGSVLPLALAGRVEEFFWEAETR